MEDSPAAPPESPPAWVQALISVAQVARSHAYAPYSNFPVGAALRGASGRVYGGGNVENAAYPLSQCAEASAIGNMAESSERRITAVVVIGGDDPCPPCGGCRQRLAEFADPETPIYLCAPDGRLLHSTTLGTLLPLAFGRHTLGKDKPSRA